MHQLNSSHMQPSKVPFLQQKITLLQQQLQDYKQKQNKQKKLNESILSTYKENQNYRQSRESKLQKDLREITLKHKQEIRKSKSQFAKEKLQFESENQNLKEKVESLQAIIEKIRLDAQKNLTETIKTLEVKHTKHLNQIECQFSQRQKQINQELQELRQLNQMYLQYIERKNIRIPGQIEGNTTRRGAQDEKYNFHSKISKPNSYRANQNIKDFHEVMPRKSGPSYNIFSKHLQGYPANHIRQTNTPYCVPSARNKQNHYCKVSPVLVHDSVKTNMHLREASQNNYTAKKVLTSSKKVISELNHRIKRAMHEISQTKRYRID